MTKVDQKIDNATDSIKKMDAFVNDMFNPNNSKGIKGIISNCSKGLAEKNVWFILYIFYIMVLK